MAEPQYTVSFRLPVPVYSWLAKGATKEKKSLNALVVALLGKAMEQERVKA